jgi:hypothetical protein
MQLGDYRFPRRWPAPWIYVPPQDKVIIVRFGLGDGGAA